MTWKFRPLPGVNISVQIICIIGTKNRENPQFSRHYEGGPKVSFRFMVTWLINCSKTHFWSTFIDSNWTKSEFSINLKADQKWVFVTWSLISKRNWGGPKLSLHAYASRDSPPSHTLLDQNLDPRVLIYLSRVVYLILNC